MSGDHTSSHDGGLRDRLHNTDNDEKIDGDGSGANDEKYENPPSIYHLPSSGMRGQPLSMLTTQQRPQGETTARSRNPFPISKSKKQLIQN